MTAKEMNKENKIMDKINKNLNIINDLLFENGFYKYINKIVTIEYCISQMYDDYKLLKKENQQLKEQLQSKKQELDGFATTIAEYLEFDEPEHSTYDEIINKIVSLKSLKQALIDIRDYCKNDSEYCGNDSYINGKNEGVKEVKQYVLQIIDKVLDLDKVRGE